MNSDLRTKLKNKPNFERTETPHQFPTVCCFPRRIGAGQSTNYEPQLKTFFVKTNPISNSTNYEPSTTNSNKNKPNSKSTGEKNKGKN